MSSYGQFCPVAKAMEVLDERWTLLVVRELMAGSTHFNELRRGNPKMSPALLSKRLRSLERAGVVRRDEVDGRTSYHLTAVRDGAQAGGRGARRLGHPLDRRAGRGRPRPAPAAVGHPPHGRRSTRGRGAGPWSRSGSPTSRPSTAHWWLCVTGDDADVCDYDPGFEVTATVVTTLSTMVAALARRPHLGGRAAHRRRADRRALRRTP